MDTVKIEDLPRNDELTVEEMQRLEGGAGSTAAPGSHVTHSDFQIQKLLDKASVILF